MTQDRRWRQGFICSWSSPCVAVLRMLRRTCVNMNEIASYQDQLSPVLSIQHLFIYFLAIVNLVFSLQSTCCIWIMGMQEAEWSTQHSPPWAVLPMVATFSVCLFSISSSTVDTSYRLSPFHLISGLTPSIHSMESSQGQGRYLVTIESCNHQDILSAGCGGKHNN